MARLMVAGNWKMNHTRAPASALVRRLIDAGLPTQVDVAVFPPAIWLRDVIEEARDSGLIVGAQNCHFAAAGAYTGELSASMLADAGCTHVIIGHSERRKYFHEDDTQVLEKTRAAFGQNLQPVVCIGETLEQREAGQTFDRLGAQLAQGLEPLGAELFSQVVIAYEPVWAIGTGRTALPEQAQEVHAFLRSRLEGILSVHEAASVRILYGGSVKAANAAALISMADVDGFLVGGASLSFEAFQPIIEAVVSHVQERK